MSFFLPAPLTMVVFSLSITTLRARPNILIVTLSSFMPSSSEISWPPVRIAMSSSIALRRSPKPGALTAATFSPPRRRLTTSVASASPSTSSALIKSGFPARRLALAACGDDQERLARLHHRLQHRQHRLQAGQLLFVQQDVDVLELGGHL